MTIFETPRTKANIDFVLPRLATGGDLHEDDHKAIDQLADMIDHDVTHMVDCRLEANDEEFVTSHDREMKYLHLGVDDDGGQMPHSWYEEGTNWIIKALRADSYNHVVVHCHMGINRGPSLAFAAMLAMGHDPVKAIDKIRTARPIAGVSYAEDALNWFHVSRDIAADQRAADKAALRAWREANPHETTRIVRKIRRGESPMGS